MSNHKRKKTKQIEDYEKKYLILGERGNGGNATVYECSKIDSEEKIALKALTNRSPEKEKRFSDEIKIMSSYCENVNGIMPISDCSYEHCWYTMPLCQSAMDYVENLPDDKDRIFQIVDNIIKVAETLVSLHSEKVSHRDLKPDNILYFNDRFTIGDFGLVDFPDNDNNLTRSDENIGSIFTIAPEMKRNPKEADGMKADVYSLAKTLWMFLTMDKKGFDGQYDCMDDSHRLHSDKKYDKKHLVEIEELLIAATNNQPEYRPTMAEFRDKLVEWKDIDKDPYKSQISDWNFLNYLLYKELSPTSVSFTNIDDIIHVLNIIGKIPAYNHMIFPRGGGFDFNKAERAVEPGCICIYADELFNIVKPKCLFNETFEDSSWNYFLLEVENNSPILGNDHEGCEEELVEDIPGHYVSDIDAIYGVYDYESGKKLPEGWRRVSRFTSGKFLILPKLGPYNQTNNTYDGRHNNCTKDELRSYIEACCKQLLSIEKLGKNRFELIRKGLFNKNPFENNDMNTVPFLTEEKAKLPDACKYIKENYKKWNFSELLCDSQIDSPLMFYFSFEGIDHFSFLENNALFLTKDGNIKRLQKEDLSEVFGIRCREKATDLCKRFNEKIKINCKGYDYDYIFDDCKFSIKWKRINKPTHLFTKKEIEALMKEADDKEGNKLVIDEYGYAQMMPIKVDGTLYPVFHEAYGARNNYIGKYSDLSILDQDYEESLTAWLDHLTYNRYVYVGDDGNIGNENEIIRKIKKFY
jgi:serine/threonine protein kinase